MAYTTRVGGVPASTVEPARWSASILSGFIASQIAGVVMAVAMIAVYSLGYGLPLLYPLNVIATYRYGDAALMSNIGAGPLVFALAFHMAVCALWGLAFAVAATVLRVDKSRWGVLALGVVIGLLSQLVDINLITPPLMNHLYGHDLWAENVPAWASWVSHLVFGLSFAVYAPMFRKLWLRFVGRDDLLRNTDDRVR